MILIIALLFFLLGIFFRNISDGKMYDAYYAPSEKEKAERDKCELFFILSVGCALISMLLLIFQLTV